MVASVEASIGYSKTDDDLESGSKTSGTKEGTSTTKGTTTNNTANSGSVNVSDVMGNITTSGSTNTKNQTTTGTSSTGGSINTNTSTNTTKGSTNTSTTSGSINELINSGSANIVTTGGSTNTGGTLGSQNKTTIGGSTSVTSDSGSVNTSQVMLSEDAVKRLTQQILEGSSGLAATSSGQNASGAYNSTVKTMLLNDLIARTAGEVAVRGAKTVQTIGGSTRTTTNSGSVNIEDIGATKNYTDIGGTTTTQDIGGNTTKQIIGGSKTVQDIGGTSSTQSGTTNIGGTITSNSSSSNANESIGGNTSSSSGKTTNNIGASTSSSTGTTDTLSNTLETFLTNTDAWSQRDTTTKDAKVTAKGGWILCTEFVKQKRMPVAFYSYGLKEFNSYDQATKDGYYVWAVPALNHLRAHPYSLLSVIMCKLLNARAEQIAAQRGCKRAKRTLLGAFAKSLSGVCWVLGHTVARKYEELHLSQGV